MFEAEHGQHVFMNDSTGTSARVFYMNWVGRFGGSSTLYPPLFPRVLGCEWVTWAQIGSLRTPYFGGFSFEK